MGTTGVNLLYLVTIVCFVLALRFLSSPATARRGNQIGAVGMAIAIVATLLQGERPPHVADGARSSRSAARSARSPRAA